MIVFQCLFSADPGMEMGGVTSRRASQASKPVTPESEGAPQKRRRKKKAATIGGVVF